MTKIKLSSHDAIVEAAFKVWNKNPGASLSDVAEHAGVGRATLHRHFSSRQQLMQTLAKIAMAELKEAVDLAVADASTHMEGLRLSLAAIIPLASRQWFLSQDIVDNDPEIAAAYEADSKELERTITAAKAEGSIDPELPTRWVAAVYENLIYAAWTLVREEEVTPKQAADLAWQTFMKGVNYGHRNT